MKTRNVMDGRRKKDWCGRTLVQDLDWGGQGAEGGRDRLAHSIQRRPIKVCGMERR